MTEELPKWQSHKIVRAAKILGVREYNVARGDQALFLEGNLTVTPPAAWWGRAGEVYVGGYYVVYDDGYASWSPAAAFEAGYTKLQEQT